MKTNLNFSTKMTYGKLFITSVLMIFICQTIFAQNSDRHFQATAMNEALNQFNNFAVSGSASINNFSLKGIELNNQQTGSSLSNITGACESVDVKTSTIASPLTQESINNDVDPGYFVMTEANSKMVHSRIKQVDDNSNENWELSASSNPATASGAITLRSNKPIQSVRVLDISGKLMAKDIIITQGCVKFAVVLSMGNLQSGIYIGQVTDISGNTKNIKLIKKY